MLSFARIARWWSLPIGLCLIAAAVTVPPPYLTEYGFNRAALGVGGLLLTIEPWIVHSVRFRAWSAAVACSGTVARALTIIDEPITKATIARTAVWVALTSAIASLTVLSFRVTKD